MFGSLKKKLKEMIDKFSGRIDSSEQYEQSELSEHKSPIVLQGPKEETKQIEKEPEKVIEIEETVEKIAKKSVEEKKEARPEETEKFLEDLDKTDQKMLEEVDKKIYDLEAEEKKIEKEIKKNEKPGIIEAEEILEEKAELIKKIEEEKKQLKTLKEELIEEREEILEKEKDIEIPIKKIEEEKKGFSILKKITEKTLSEEDTKDILEEIKHVLLENDVALEVVERICNDVKLDLVGKSIKRGKTKEIIESALKNAVFDVLNQENIDIEKLIQNNQEPILIIFLGFNGVGKTTTLARVAYKYKKYNPVLAAGDTFRAASIEQLEEHSKKLGLDIVKHRYGADSAAVIFDAKKHAIAKGFKLVLADTAGRSHTNANLMDELKKVCRVNKPDLKVLVLDAITGNDIYEQARLFDQAVGVDAIILTKTDVYEKGGAALSAAYTIKKPIIFLGTGQEYKNLEEFNPEKVVRNLLE